MNAVVNTEEFIGKTVGRRTAPIDSLKFAMGLQATMHALRPMRIRKGVYRFKSHEEADQWLMDRLTQKLEN